MRCPAADLHFAEHPAHGVIAQQALIRPVLDRVEGRRRVVDAGAHIGIWSVALAKHFRRVEAFEPDENNFACLRENCRDLSNVFVRPQALGRNRRSGQVLVGGSNSGTAYIVDGGDVSIVPIDDYLWDDVDLIKIDVEGMEGEVVLGAERTISVCWPAIFFEDNGLGAVHYGKNWIDPKDLLRELGYHCRLRIAKNELWTC